MSRQLALPLLICCGCTLAATSVADQPSAVELPDLGQRVIVFDPSMPMADIQAKINDVFAEQEENQFGDSRYALLFKPGEYELDVNIGYYTHVVGLGYLPGDVHIRGGLRSTADWFNDNATHNFWRAAENLAVTPTLQPSNLWAVSQAAPLRRVHIRGSLSLFQNAGWSSGGYLADAVVDESVISGTQQQWFTRNSTIGRWEGGVWNMVFMGVDNSPQGEWPKSPYTVIVKTPVVREKPFLYLDDQGKFAVFVPGLRHESRGTSWQTGTPVGTSVPIDDFHVAKPETDSARSLNEALASGKHLLFTPGIYELESTIEVKNPNCIVLGLGLATMRPTTAAPAMTVADVPGVSIAGLLFDAGKASSSTLLEVGSDDSSADHSADPTCLYDVFCRVGGAGIGMAESCVTINSRNVVGDHFWLWCADHGLGTEWHENRSANGLIVNGDDVTIYGLMVEHFQKYQTVWNGNGGRVYFYQSEMPYDPPFQAAWQHEGVNGWASYKVADSVTQHQAFGLGVYCTFQDAAVVADNAIEAPQGDKIRFHHALTFWLSGKKGSGIGSILSGSGDAVNESNRKATLD